MTGSAVAPAAITRRFGLPDGVRFLIIIVITHHESALFLRLFRLFAFFLILVVIIFRFGFLVVVEVILVIRIDVIEIGVEIVKIGVVYLSVLIVKCIILERLLLLGRGALLRGSLARGLRCGGCLFAALFFVEALRVAAFFVEVVFSVRSACSMLAVVSLVAKLILLLILPRSVYHMDPLLARANRQLCE